MDDRKKNIIIIGHISEDQFEVFKKDFLEEQFKINKYENENLEEAFNYINELAFVETFIILNEEIKNNFYEKFKKNLKTIRIIPKFFILSENEEDLCSTKDFYDYRKGNFQKIKNFILNLIKEREKEYQKILKKIDEEERKKNEKVENSNINEYNFENNISLINPFMNKLISNCFTSKEEVYEQNKWLCDNFFSSDKDENDYLYQIKDIYNIPIELLCKHYIMIYTHGGEIWRKMKKDLMTKKLDDTLFQTYIKVIYLGSKLNIYEQTSKNELYSGAKFSNYEIKEIKEIIENKKKSNKYKVFAKRFISFSESKAIALQHKRLQFYNTLLILNLNDDTNILNNNIPKAYGKVVKLSKINEEDEVLFFPYSCFEISNIKQIDKNDYVIKMSYADININKPIIEKESQKEENQNEIINNKIKSRKKISGKKIMGINERKKKIKSLYSKKDKRCSKMTKLEVFCILAFLILLVSLIIKYRN